MSWSTPLTALPHLSDEAVAAFADGVLGETARQRAQSHMAGCGECSDAVRGQRAASAFLRSAPSPILPAGLLAKLRELPITAELPAAQFASALTLDGQPLFSSFGAEMVLPAPRPELSPTAPPQTVLPPVPLTPPQPILAPQQILAPHRHVSTRAGLGAAAAAALAVGVLASTAATAGGVTPIRSTSSVARVVPAGTQTSARPGPAIAPAGLLVPTFNPSVGK